MKKELPEYLLKYSKQNLDVKNRLMEYISSHIHNLTIIGGEPTVIPEFYELLDYCDKQNTLNEKNIVIVTNLTNTNTINKQIKESILIHNKTPLNKLYKQLCN